jgi:NAD(P)-dependent dehydrogenase (short-subunit alcohol dehydrogenase family)
MSSSTALPGTIALVTGAARGIGLATSERLARDGYRVILTDVDVAELDKAVAALQAAGHTVQGRAFDVTDGAQVRAVVDEISALYGGVDVLVNNAGVAVFDDPLMLTDDEWQRCMSVDLEGVWKCTQAVLGSMLDRGGGSIVNIASVHSFQIIRGCFPYPVAKHAVIGLTRALAVEYADRAIRVNAVCPGYVDTPLTREYYQGFPDPAGQSKLIADIHPMRRIASTEDIAAAVAFLAGCESSYITGVSLPVDGGRSVVYHD